MKKIIKISIVLLCIVVLIKIYIENNTKMGRKWLENNFATEVSKVYPTQRLEDLFEIFPKGFVISQYYVKGDYRIKLKLSGNAMTKQISGDIIQILRGVETDEEIAKIGIIYKNNKFIFSDEEKAKELWPKQEFLFQKVKINKDYLSKLKVEEKSYNYKNGGMSISYKLNSKEIEDFLNIEGSKDYILGFYGSKANKGYRHTTVVEHKENFLKYHFSEIIESEYNVE